MLVFAHTGFTLAAAALLSGMAGNRRSQDTETEAKEQPPKKRTTLWLDSLGSFLDIRLLMVGALLPDIIDKPVGQLFFRETFSNGRIFCHTLLFLILITSVGLFVYWRYKKTWGLALSFGTFTHLILDGMWLTPGTLFWPLLGTTFERVEISAWFRRMLYLLFSNPAVCLPEVIGAAVIAWFGWLLLRRRRLGAFIKYGRLP